MIIMMHKYTGDIEHAGIITLMSEQDFTLTTCTLLKQ